jgi:hypothetical protein
MLLLPMLLVVFDLAAASENSRRPRTTKARGAALLRKHRPEEQELPRPSLAYSLSLSSERHTATAASSLDASCTKVV